MSIISWLLTGLIAGSLAKYLTSEKESSSWITSIIIGILGSIAGGFLFGLIGFSSKSFIADILTATIGAFLLLKGYYIYLDKKKIELIY